ncbi:MAG: endonuclease/exonuclease/phosphatase family protein [Spirochaetia bacterium]|nr:endonuclease/exonuclease/phosphatase family protein [Spirochaetia bacterium]
MKHRAFLAALAAASFLALASCVPATLPSLKSSEKQLSSLSVLASDNPEAGLATDYSFTWNRNRQAFISIPPQAPFDADLSGLAARFKISDGASASVDGAPVESGDTPIDFRAGALFKITAEDGSTVELLALLGQEPPPPSPPGDAIGVDVTVVSYNAEDFFAGSVARHSEIASMLKAISADVVILTETESTGTNNDVALLQSALRSVAWPLDESFAADSGYEDDVVIVSRFPINQLESHVLTCTTGAASGMRPGALAKIKVENGLGEYVYLTVMGFHLKAMIDGLPTRLIQSSSLAAYLRATFTTDPDDLDSGYYILAGDMNTVAPGDRGSGTSTMGYLRLFDDATSGNDFWAVNESLLPTTPTHQMGSVLDHIILSPALAERYIAGTVDVVDYVPGVSVDTISDHYPVLLELAL